jgi:GNAT superfamily N-acetyltransferase
MTGGEGTEFDHPAADDPSLPPGHRFVTLAEQPTLRAAMGDHNVAVWPEFMLKDPVAARDWDHLFDDWPAFQACLLDPDGALVAAYNSAPIYWDGTDDGLPTGWDDQFERSVADLAAGRAPNTLGAIQIVVAPGHQGRGLAGRTLEEMRATGRRYGLGSLIACVRPTDKARYPLMSIDDYTSWRRADGLPADPWVRIHVRAGGRIVRPSPSSMTITGTIDQWRSWTGLGFPVSGPYLVPFATNPVEVDLAADLGTYHDANIWIVHDPIA